MNIPLISANILVFLAFIIHTVFGDMDLRVIQPEPDSKDWEVKQEKWTMARCGWHWISFDLLFASVGLGLINFTEFFKNETILLQILFVYFLGYSIVWLLTILISKKFPMNFFKLGQWILLLSISGLIYWGIV